MRRDGRICFPIFSSEDIDLASMKWRLSRSGYARTSINRKVDGQRITTSPLAHRMVLARILGRPLTQHELCDHINFNRIDCRRSNLRLATRQQNSQHCQARGTAGIRGVTFHKKSGKWQASVGIKGKNYYCGLHETAEAAGKAAAKMRKKLNFFGETS